MQKQALQTRPLGFCCQSFLNFSCTQGARDRPDPADRNATRAEQRSSAAGFSSALGFESDPPSSSGSLSWSNAVQSSTMHCKGPPSSVLAGLAAGKSGQLSRCCLARQALIVKVRPHCRRLGVSLSASSYSGAAAKPAVPAGNQA